MFWVSHSDAVYTTGSIWHKQLYQHNMHIMCIYRLRNTDPCEPQVLYIGFGYRVFQPGTDAICYNTYGVTCTEVEMDVLTGQYLISRVDLLYDCGERYGHISNNTLIFIVYLISWTLIFIVYLSFIMLCCMPSTP
jgi:CO/xanthine dehydrogenase Mo-binding subunit